MKCSARVHSTCMNRGILGSCSSQASNRYDKDAILIKTILHVCMLYLTTLLTKLHSHFIYPETHFLNTVFRLVLSAYLAADMFCKVLAWMRYFFPCWALCAHVSTCVLDSKTLVACHGGPDLVFSS